MSRKASIVSALSAASEATAALVLKLEKAKEKEAQLGKQLADIDAIEALGVGSLVIVTVGRGDTKVTTTGTIRAVKAGETIPAKEEGGEATVGERTFKVEVSRTGDEFDSEFVVVKEGQVAVPGSEPAAEEEEAAE